MRNSPDYFFIVGMQGLCPDGTLSRRPGEWEIFDATDVDRHLNAGTRPTGMKSGDFHARGSYRFNLAAGRSLQLEATIQ